MKVARLYRGVVSITDTHAAVPNFNDKFMLFGKQGHRVTERNNVAFVRSYNPAYSEEANLIRAKSNVAACEAALKLAKEAEQAVLKRIYGTGEAVSVDEFAAVSA